MISLFSLFLCYGLCCSFTCGRWFTIRFSRIFGGIFLGVIVGFPFYGEWWLFFGYNGCDIFCKIISWRLKINSIDKLKLWYQLLMIIHIAYQQHFFVFLADFPEVNSNCAFFFLISSITVWAWEESLVELPKAVTHSLVNFSKA